MLAVVFVYFGVLACIKRTAIIVKGW